MLLAAVGSFEPNEEVPKSCCVLAKETSHMLHLQCCRAVLKPAIHSVCSQSVAANSHKAIAHLAYIQDFEAKSGTAQT